MTRNSLRWMNARGFPGADVRHFRPWAHLEPGDVIDIVAPASSSSDRGLKGAVRFVEEFGLVPRVPKDIFGDDIICSNTDDYRFQHLKKALYARDSKAVWCLRGGYGSARLLPALTRLKPPSESKLFIGYSDITALHHFLNYFWRWPTLHAAMLEGLGRGEGGKREITEIRNLTFGVQESIVFENLQPMNAAARAARRLRSAVVGGNLAVLLSALGTPWQMHPTGKILMLEDIGERGYRVDRMLVQMRQAGYFKGVKAVIFGDFVGGEEPDDSSYLWKEVQKLFAKESTFPVLKGLPCGHGIFQRPLPFFTPSVLRLGRNPTLEVGAGFR